MHRLVLTVFRTIFLSLIFIFVFDIGFYVYRAFSVNQRMESIMTSMQKVVMENNYLPDADYQMYKAIFLQLEHDMNNGDTFIEGIGLNYTQDAAGAGILTSLTATDVVSGTNRDLLVKRMNKPARYGDVMIVQSAVRIRQPIWGFGTATNNYLTDTDYFSKGTRPDARNWNRVGYSATTFFYTYYVPCLKYQSIHDV
ncbi:MAG: hypothetical protein IKP66_03170 [Lachnospiraceae bacterium]|nr:hypothetical protein [Lachnospiraceae bacterium]